MRAVGPLTLLPAGLEQMGVRVCTKLEEGMRDADVIIMLRLQSERMRGALLPSAAEYFANYGLTAESAGVGEARCDRDASRADESRRRDRFARC